MSTAVISQSHDEMHAGRSTKLNRIEGTAVERPNSERSQDIVSGGIRTEDCFFNYISTADARIIENRAPRNRATVLGNTTEFSALPRRLKVVECVTRHLTFGDRVVCIVWGYRA